MPLLSFLAGHASILGLLERRSKGNDEDLPTTRRVFLASGYVYSMNFAFPIQKAPLTYPLGYPIPRPRQDYTKSLADTSGRLRI